ncbi:MAG: adenylate/guanylate cyclase domain-containing protein [Cyanobacteria bacterium J007]|nr:MAG: adenylate/guanylate cyclase domain-containing protein [Cyanobacteria bacterium J007]
MILGVRGWLRRTLIRDYPWWPGAIAGAVSAAIALLGLWEPLERFGYNQLFKLRGSLSWNERIVTVAIDETSLQVYGQFPWSRDRYVQLLDVLNDADPAAIGFDILFLDPSPQDARLAEAIARNGRVVLARGAWGEEPLPILQDAAAAVGQILHEADRDGISRQATLWIEGIPNLSLAMLQVSGDLPSSDLLAELPQRAIARYQSGVWYNFWVNWPGKMQAVPTYSFVDVVEGRVPMSAFANKFVFVGAVATGLDRKISPFQAIAGVYIHAAVADNWLEDRFLRRWPAWVSPWAAIAFALGTGWLLSGLDWKHRVGLLLLLPSVWVGIALGAFTWVNWWLPTATPIGTIALSAIAVQVREQYQKQQLMRLFETQVAPETARTIWQQRHEIFQHGAVPPQEAIATILFMDIRGFTTISEQMPPRELLPWLNEYLDVMSNCIMNCGGAIDKYIGDAIMACFGVPFVRTTEAEIQQDALNAIAACFKMHEQLQVLNRHFKATGKPPIRFGIGIHTGPVIAGSVGGSRRSNYSVLGDTVNIAARLEPMNKEILDNNPYSLLITRETFAYVRDRYPGRKVGELQLRGRQEITEIYSIQNSKI